MQVVKNMLKEISATLKNKSNLIYIIIIILLFIILNISLNLNSFIDSYYDSKVENYINETARVYQEVNKDELKGDFKKLLLADSSSTSVDKLKEILKDKKQVKNIKLEEMTYIDLSVDFVYIELNDWKDCIDIKEYLDSQGIETYYQAEEIFYKNYGNIEKYFNIIKYFIIILTVLILIVICNNILKNELKNIKGLIVFGYNKRQIKTVTFLKLFSLVFIGFCIGIIMAQLFLYIFSNILKINIDIKIASKIIFNLITIIIPIFIIIIRTSNKKIYK